MSSGPGEKHHGPRPTFARASPRGRPANAVPVGSLGPLGSLGALPAMRFGVLLALLLASPGLFAKPYKLEAGPHIVKIVEGAWTDAARNNREVPYRLYAPLGLKEPGPIVIWSHGLGGSRQGAEYLGRHLATHGYYAFHIQHQGSDEALLRELGVQGMLREITRRPQASIDRFGDIPFVVTSIKAMNESGTIEGKLDTGNIGFSGHSFGAITTMVAAGQQMAQVGQRYAVPELKGAFAMSPSLPRSGTAEEAFAAMKVPVFHLTGTKDASPLKDFEPSDRQRPYEIIHSVDQELLVFDGGVHMTFSGRRSDEDPNLDRHHAVIEMAATAYWDWRLRGDEAARIWLEEGGLAGELAPGDKFEHKKAVAK